MTAVWMVKDLTQEDLYSGHFDEFGPFPTEAAAREFAQLRDSYWPHACAATTPEAAARIAARARAGRREG